MRNPPVAASAAALGLILVSPVPVAASQPGPAAERALESAGQDLQVRVAFAPEFARMSGWGARFECAATRASDLLEAAIGRRLVVRDRVLWRAPAGEKNLYALRAHIVREVDPGGADLVIGLIRAAPEGRRKTDRILEEGLAAYSHGYVVLRVDTELCSAYRLLAHEIAHVFGGIHRFEPGNLMDHRAPGEAIDELNAVLFALHRDRSVRTRPPPLDGRMQRMMRGMARADIEAPGTWLRVGVIAASMGKHAEALEHYERALTIRPDLRAAWANLGHAHLHLGRLVEAREAYERALTIDPGNGRVYNNLAAIYLSGGDPERASEAADRARELGYEVPDELLEAIADAGGGR